MKFFKKIGITFMMLFMSPMLMDSPGSTVEGGKKMLWQGIKDLWAGKLDHMIGK